MGSLIEFFCIQHICLVYYLRECGKRTSTPLGVPAQLGFAGMCSLNLKWPRFGATLHL